MSSHLPSIASDRFQASTRQLLPGLFVAMLFVLFAITSFSPVTDVGRTQSVTSSASSSDDRIDLTLTFGPVTGRQSPQTRNSMARVIAELSLENHQRSHGQSAAVRLPDSAGPGPATSVTTSAETTELVKLIGRTARNSRRSFCLMTSNPEDMPTCIQYAGLLAEAGQLSADRVSFRIAVHLPEDEIWLEVREVIPHDDKLSETGL